MAKRGQIGLAGFAALLKILVVEGVVAEGIGSHFDHKRGAPRVARQRRHKPAVLSGISRTKTSILSSNPDTPLMSVAAH
jgi:hypothetical protein